MNEWMDNGHWHYPYNEIRKTRSTMECEWILMASTQPNQRVYHACLVKAFDTDILQDLMITGHAIPMCPNLEYCLVKMMDWGESYDKEWYNSVVRMLYLIAVDFDPLTKKEVCGFAIQEKILHEVHTHFVAGTLHCACLTCDWWKKYDNEIWDETGGDFPQAAIRSFQYLRYKLLQVQNYGLDIVYPEVMGHPLWNNS